MSEAKHAVQAEEQPIFVHKLAALIHGSDINGVFIESGCGVPVASSLLAVPKASSTVVLTECPYSKAVLQNKYGVDLDAQRSVSEHTVARILEFYRDADEYKKMRVNTVYVASFQIGDRVHDPTTCTHGWIGLAYKDSTRFYHVSIREPLTRTQYIERIGQVGIELIFMRNQLFVESASSELKKADSGINSKTEETASADCSRLVPTAALTSSIDMVLDANFKPLTEHALALLQMHSNSSSGTSDAFLAFDASGSMVRLEQVFRDRQHCILFKGSFNPPTVAHLDMMVKTRERFPDAAAAFMISVHTVDKGVVSSSDILRRIRWINAMGYVCILNTKGRFADAYAAFSVLFPACKLVFPIGDDTARRLEPETALLPVHWQQFPRTEESVSSTKVRQLLADKEYGLAKTLLPLCVFRSLIPPGVEDVSKL